MKRPIGEFGTKLDLRLARELPKAVSRKVAASILSRCVLPLSPKFDVEIVEQYQAYRRPELVMNRQRYFQSFSRGLAYLRTRR
jgi:hypothetical protein